MMKIGVVSDTHSFDIPQQLINDFKKVDLIIHAGDMCSLDDLKVFPKNVQLKAVFGNMDGLDVRKKFPEKQVIKCEDVSIGLFHGRGSKTQVLDSVKNAFEGQELDLIIFGHSHAAYNEKIDTTIYFNPGSPNDKVYAPCCSYGFIEIKGKKINARIKKVEE